MTERGQGTCVAIVLLLGLTGCTLDAFNAQVQETRTGSAEPRVSGSVESTAERARAMVQGLG